VSKPKNVKCENCVYWYGPLRGAPPKGHQLGLLRKTLRLISETMPVQPESLFDTGWLEAVTREYVMSVSGVGEQSIEIVSEYLSESGVTFLGDEPIEKKLPNGLCLVSRPDKDFPSSAPVTRDDRWCGEFRAEWPT